MPPRHGKSDMVTRFFAARLIGLFPWAEIIICQYNTPKALEMSADIQTIVKSDAYKEIFPDIEIPRGKSSLEIWGTAGNIGKLRAAGIRAGITGGGCHFGILDDYCKNREDAESLIIREKSWKEFSDSFFTRRAPVSIFIVMATLWHVDDIVGRILKKMDEDKAFPRFEVIKFPAKDVKYETGYLFPERFSQQYYEEEFAVLGSYSSAALMQCNPQVKGGNILKVDKIRIIEKMPDRMKLVRAWDLASSEKERTGEDPDYTVGILMSRVDRKTMIPGMYLTTIFIHDIIRGRWEAPKRDEIIRQAAWADGPEVKIAIEAVAGYKDAYTSLKHALKGIRMVTKITTVPDLIVRTSPLEAIFEAGNVRLKKAPWNDVFISEVANFAGSSSLHDDQVAAMVTGFEALGRKQITAIY
jgi:predicted phage terminase large subunit-like protein